MKEFVRKMLTRTVTVETRARRRVTEVEVPPSNRLVYGTILIIAVLAALVTLEVAHLIFLECWNTEVFTGITGLVGTLVGLVLERRA